METTHAVLACLTADEERAREVLAEAGRLAENLNAPLSVVHVYPAVWNGPLRPYPTAWHLKTDDPEALRRFASRRRITRLVL